MTYSSDNISIKLLLFLTENGPAYGHKITAGYLRQKHNVSIAKKE